MAWSVANDLLIESYFHRNPRIVLGYFITQKSPESHLCWLNQYLVANPLDNTNKCPVGMEEGGDLIFFLLLLNIDTDS